MPEEVAEAFRSVLLNQGEFYDVFNREGTMHSTTLNDYFLALFSENIPYGFIVDLEFAVVDLDEDGIPEIVVNVKGPNIRLVLRHENSLMYGYWFATKEMGGITKDGTFSVSGSASFWAIAKLRFTGYQYEEITLALYDGLSSYPAADCYINDELVTEEEFDAFITAYDNKEDVVWHDLTKENVLNYVR
jgi:hypothetical protein